MNIRSGLAWGMAARVGSQLTQFFVSVALARLLDPATFGVVALLTVFGGFALILVDSGISSALIQRRDATDADKSTSFWLQIALGTSLTLLFFVLSGPLASFFGKPDAKPLFQVFSSIFLLQAFGLTQVALLQRDGHFRALAVIAILSALLPGTTAVAMAIMDFGAWALLAQSLGTAALTSVLYWLASTWRPSFRFSRASAREIAGYSSYLLGHSGLNYWMRNGDNLLIGKFLGDMSLGLYNRAYTLMLLPVNNVSAIFSQVMFPALCRVQDDLVAFKQKFFKALESIAFVAFPLSFGLFLTADSFVRTIYGDKWVGMIPLLQILTLVGMLQSVTFPVGWVFTALAQTRKQFRLSIYLMVAFVVSMAIGLPFGLIGVTWAYAAWAILSTSINFAVVNRMMNSSFRDFWRSVRSALFCTLVMGAGVIVLDHALGSVANWVRLLTSVGVGSIVYLAAALVSRNAALRDLIEMTRPRSRSFTPTPL